MSEAPARGRGRRRAPAARPIPREEAAVQLGRSGFELDHHPAHMVRRLHQRGTQLFQQMMDGDGLSPTQFAALVAILKHGAVSQNHLGRLTSMDPSTISTVVRTLLKDRLVERRRSTADQRLVILTLTDEGAAYTLERVAASAEVGRRLLAPLTGPERQVFLGLLAKLTPDEAGRHLRLAAGKDDADEEDDHGARAHRAGG